MNTTPLPLPYHLQHVYLIFTGQILFCFNEDCNGKREKKKWTWTNRKTKEFDGRVFVAHEFQL